MHTVWLCFVWLWFVISWLVCFNSLAPGKFEWHFIYVIFKQILVIDGWGISCEIALMRMSLRFTDDQSTLVQVMAWCRQAPSHYLGQCWPRSLLSYGVSRPQWVNLLISFRVAYLTPRQSLLSASEVVLNDMGKMVGIKPHQLSYRGSITKHKLFVHFLDEL